MATQNITLEYFYSQAGGEERCYKSMTAVLQSVGKKTERRQGKLQKRSRASKRNSYFQLDQTTLRTFKIILCPLYSKCFVLKHMLSRIKVNFFKKNSLPICSINLVAIGQLRYVGV